MSLFAETVQIPFICSADQVKVIDDRCNDGMAGRVDQDRTMVL